MKSLKTLIFTCLILFSCLGTALAATCYTPSYGYYQCDPNYQGPYPYPDEDPGIGFFGVVIGGGDYYGDDHRDHWHGDHGGRGSHGGDHHHR